MVTLSNGVFSDAEFHKAKKGFVNFFKDLDGTKLISDTVTLHNKLNPSDKQAYPQLTHLKLQGWRIRRWEAECLLKLRGASLSHSPSTPPLTQG